jgi:hypothetical protein
MTATTTASREDQRRWSSEVVRPTGDTRIAAVGGNHQINGCQRRPVSIGQPISGVSLPGNTWHRACRRLGKPRMADGGARHQALPSPVRAPTAFQKPERKSMKDMKDMKNCNC